MNQLLGVPTGAYLLVGAALFCLGALGAALRPQWQQQVAGMVMMFAGVGLSAAAFARQWGTADGQTIGVVSAALVLVQLAVGTAIRRREPVTPHVQRESSESGRDEDTD